MTRPVGSLNVGVNIIFHEHHNTAYRVAQYSKVPFPLPIRVSLPFIQTGISGKHLSHTLAPFHTFNFLLITSSAVVNCFALSRMPFPRILMPQSPKANVVPRVEPPMGMGTRPLCRLRYLTFRGANWPRDRVRRVMGERKGRREGRRREVMDERENITGDVTSRLPS